MEVKLLVAEQEVNISHVTSRFPQTGPDNDYFMNVFKFFSFYHT